MKKLIIISLQFMLCAAIYAQNTSTGYQAYLSNSQELWKRSVAISKDDQAKAIAYLGLLNSTMSTRDEELFDEYYDQAIEHLEKMEDGEKHMAVAKALQSSIYGFALSYDSWKGVYLGPKSSMLIEDAIELAPNNPIVLKQMASYKLYTPSTFGGDVEQALKYFEKSVDRFEKEGETVNNWLYLDALTHLGITQRKSGQVNEAIATFEKVLEIEPKFNWVSNTLLPNTKSELK